MNIDDLVKNGMQDTKDDMRPKYDVLDDLTCHMKDDTSFYRKMYYPTMVKCQECYNSGDKDKAFKFLLPMIDNGLKHYKARYDLPYAEEQLLSMDEKKDLARKIYEEEVEAFKEGEY